MQERQVFALIVRTVGLVVVVYSTVALFYIPAKLCGIATRSPTSIAGLLLFFFVFFVVGVAIMRSAKWIVLLAFGAEKNSN